EGALLARLDEPLSDPDTGAPVDAPHRGDVGVGASALGVVLIGPQQDPGVEDLFGPGGAVAGQRGAPLARRGGEMHVVLVTRPRTRHGRHLPNVTGTGYCDILA